MHFKKRKGKREDRSQFTGLQFKLNKEKKYIFLVVLLLHVIYFTDIVSLSEIR
jgi:hypothetical protein